MYITGKGSRKGEGERQGSINIYTLTRSVYYNKYEPYIIA